MKPPTDILKRLAVWALVSLTAGGCTCLPRIDPSGERCCIWPKDEPRVASLTAAPTTVVAPPVGTDAVFPTPAMIATAPSTGPASLGVTPATAALAQVPQDTVSITPQRILAPVGSEVVLKAHVCTTEGYTLADQEVEWMLGRNGVGEFVEVSGKGWLHPPLLPWNKPKKVDSYRATGWTAAGPLCITRGTADPADDVEINRGDAWVSVTSPNEGTSAVTAFMPTVETWATRRASAFIYWVDVQWVFPPANLAGTGRPEMLTTTVTRQTSGAPIEGWIVRYSLADGGGTLSGGGSGQVVEMRTDAQGRATVEVAPTASGAPSSRVNVELVRPAGFAGSDMPELTIGSGSTVITWGGSSYLGGGATVPSQGASGPVTPIPTIPGGTSPPSGGWQPPGSTAPPTSGSGPTFPTIPAARPELQLELRGDTQAYAGSVANLEFVIRNNGNAPATEVKLLDRIDRGLMYPPNPDSSEVEFTGVGTILPGEQKSRTITFHVLQTGRLCHNAVVRSAEGSEAAAQMCIAATQPPVERVGHMSVSKDGPRQGFQGQSVLFRVTVKNDGELPLVDVTVIDEYPTALLSIKPINDPNVRIASGVLTRTIPRLEPGQQATFEVEAVCLRTARQVMPTPLVRVTARTDPPTRMLETSDDHSLEILPVDAGGTGAAGAPAPAGAAPSLGIRTVFPNPTARVGTRTSCQVTVINRGTVDDANVIVRVAFPPQLTPDATRVQAPPQVRPTLDGNQLTFSPVATLRPGEPLTYTIPLNVNGVGIVNVVAGVISDNGPPGGVSQTDTLEITSQ